METFTARRSYLLADNYRRQGKKVVMGGFHVTFMPDEALLHADSIFIGDAESRWVEMIDDARRGCLKVRYDAPPGIAQIDACQRSILPRRDLFIGKGYLPISLMQFSRGCRFACSFCAVSQYFGRRSYLRQVDEVVREIESQGHRFVFFVDDNIASDHHALAELCHALIPLNINWISQASIDVTKNRPLMDLMRKSGCWGNVIGFEPITPQNLRDARKSPNIYGFTEYRDEIAALRDFGLQTWAAFTLGYDNDTP